MALSYNLGYQESISVHPTRRQNFAGKPDSNFPNIWEWLIYWNKWRFGRVSAIPHSQTLKDRATKLLRSWSRALITQLWLRGQSSLLASIWIRIQECRCLWEWLEVWWVAVKENHLSESFNPSTQSTELPSWTHRTIKKETCSVLFLTFKRKLSLFFLTDKKTIFGRDCNSSFTLAVTF